MYIQTPWWTSHWLKEDFLFEIKINQSINQSILSTVYASPPLVTELVGELCMEHYWPELQKEGIS